MTVDPRATRNFRRWYGVSVDGQETVPYGGASTLHFASRPGMAFALDVERPEISARGSPMLLSVRKSGDFSLSTSFADITGWNTPDISTAHVSFSNGVVTVNTAGLMVFDLLGSAVLSAVALLSTIQIKAQRDPGGGYSDIPGAIVKSSLSAIGAARHLYLRGVVNAAVGDKVKFRGLKSGTPTVNLEAAGLQMFVSVA